MPFFDRILTRFLRVFFYLLYQPMAWSYDLVAAMVSWGRWKDWVMTVLPYLEGPRVLEIGHGPGHLQIALNEKGIQVFGIDASRQMGLQARTRILEKGIIPQISRAYAQILPFTHEVFDQIVATFPTEDIYAYETLYEAYRTLAPGGEMIILPTAWITGKKWIDRVTTTLFQITGQSPDWDIQWLTPFVNIGFQPDFAMIKHKSWSLVIIIAHKPDN